jgi:hypothetical protein
MTLNDAMLFEDRKRIAEFSVNSRLPATQTIVERCGSRSLNAPMKAAPTVKRAFIVRAWQPGTA